MFIYNKYLFGICLISYAISSYSMELSRPKDGTPIKITYLSDVDLKAVENIDLNVSDYATESETETEEYMSEDEDCTTKDKTPSADEQDTLAKEALAVAILGNHFKKSVNKN